MSASEPAGPRALPLDGPVGGRMPAPADQGAAAQVGLTDARRRAPVVDAQREDGPRAAETGEPAAPVRFEVGMAELERIVRELESGDLGLDQALALYERGVALVRACGAQLDTAEARLQVLTLNAEGQPVLRPLEESGA